MTISLNQSPLVLGSYSGSLASAAAAGDTLLYVVTAYTTSGSTISSSAPLYNGASVTGATQLKAVQASGTDAVYTAIWMLPSISGSHTSVAITVSGDTVPGDTKTVGLTVYDVAGLGSSPALDKGNTASGTGTSVTSGASGNITQLPEFVLGSYVTFGQTIATAGAPWTEPAQLTDQFQSSGYQIITSGTASYTYAQTDGASSAWAGAIVTLYAGGAAAAATPGPLVVPSPAAIQAANW